MEHEGDLEGDLNKVMMDLVDGFTALAESLKKGSSGEELADQLESMARSVCDHWPDCRSRETKVSGC